MKDITKELDKIATHLELQGQKKLAATLDLVANELDKVAEQERKAQFVKELSSDYLKKLRQGTRDGLKDLIKSVFGADKVDHVSSIALEVPSAKNPSGVVILAPKEDTTDPFVEPLPTAKKEDIDHIKKFIENPESFQA